MTVIPGQNNTKDIFIVYRFPLHCVHQNVSLDFLKSKLVCTNAVSDVTSVQLEPLLTAQVSKYNLDHLSNI